MIIDQKDERREYHPVGVSDPHRLSCYNPTIRQKRIKNQICQLVDNKIIALQTNAQTQPRRGVKIIEDKICIRTKPRRGAMIIATNDVVKSKPRRGKRIIENNMIIDQKNEWRKYHPVGVSDPHRLSCYNHTIRQLAD